MNKADVAGNALCRDKVYHRNLLARGMDFLCECTLAQDYTECLTQPFFCKIIPHLAHLDAIATMTTLGDQVSDLNHV